MDWTANEKLTGDRTVLKLLEAGEEPARIEQQYLAALEQFRQHRSRFLLY
jgi:hypothetical protein